MAVNDILLEIDQEIARLQQVKQLLGGMGISLRGRKGVASFELPPLRRKRNISPEGRQRIVDAVKRRWAAQKNAAALQR